MNNANIKLSVLAGLLKDWGVFNLYDLTAYMGINVEIFTSGKTYIESEECNVIHAGESGYKEFEGVFPINGTNWDLTPLGDKLKSLLKPYFLSEESNLVATALDELYDSVTSYQEYKNQFSINFLDVTRDTETLGQYYDYLGNIIDFIDENNVAHTSILRSLASLKGTSDAEFLYINAKIINYSKYYNIYATDDTVLTPVLRPLLYDLEDLEKYGLGIDETNRVPYVKFLWRGNFYYGHSGTGKDLTYIDHWIHGYNPTSKYYDVEANVLRTRLYFKQNKDLSLFTTNISSYKTFWSEDEAWWAEFPKGFILFGMNDESSTKETFNRNDERDTGQRNQNHQSDYTSIFNMADTTFDFNKKYVDCGLGDTPLLAIAYNGDSSGNVHVFNSWFPVESLGTNRPTLKISYQASAQGKYPEYIGLIVASLLANIYVYSEKAGEGISYIPDVIYLSNHATTYTKDVIYMAKLSSNVLSPSSLLLFHNYPFSDYILAIKDRIHSVNGETYSSSDKNITLELKSCIKNIPLQFKLGYVLPNLDLVGVKSGRAKVLYIDGTWSDVILNSNSKDELYQVEPNKNVAVANVLGKNFKMRYLKHLENASEGNGLIGEFDTTVADEKNEKVVSTFKLESSELGLKNTEHMLTGYSYAIVTHYEKDVALHHFPKNEVIAPFAKIF